MQSSNARKHRKKHRREAGEAEMMFFGVVLIICGIISGSLLILNWIKDTKNDRVARQREAAYAKGTPTPIVINPDPASYWALCKNSQLGILQTTYDCTVLPESYGELDFLPSPGERISFD